MNYAKKIVGNIINTKKKGKDIDGDRVPDYKDCQPKNTMRQDVGRAGMKRVMSGLERNTMLEDNEKI